MDFFLDEKILYFYDPPPPVYQEREEQSDDRFTIEQLKSIIKELRTNSDAEGNIKSSTFVNLMMVRTTNS